MPKISIIVPVYNTAKYVERCLDSIINQTYLKEADMKQVNMNQTDMKQIDRKKVSMNQPNKNQVKKEEIEIIVVNDGSTDNSEEVIKSYINEHKNVLQIKYYVKENTGIAKTRNFGIEKASAPYILFVDSDDYIDIHLIEKLETYMEQDIDLIKFKLQRVKQNGEVLEKVDGPVFDKVTGEEAFNKLYSEDILLDSPCVYLIKKELFTKNNFKFQRTYHEDFGLIPLLILKAKTVVSTPDYLYSYVQAPNSITRNESYEKTLKKMEDALGHYDNMIEQTKKMELQKTTLENVKIYYTNAIILKLKELQEKDKNHYIKEIKKRKLYNNIKARNLKQLIKKVILKINVKLYLKLR